MFHSQKQFWLSLDLKNGTDSTSRGKGSKPDVTITMADADFAVMTEGKLGGMQAFMDRKLKITGRQEEAAS